MNELIAELAKQLALVPDETWMRIGNIFASIAGGVVLVLTKRPETIGEALRLFAIAVLISSYVTPFVMKKWLFIESNELVAFGRFVSALGALRIHKRLEQLINGKEPTQPKETETDTDHV